MVTAGGGDDILDDYNSKGSDHNTLDGGPGDDRIAAGAGTDTVIGGAGHDILSIARRDRVDVRDAALDEVRCEGRPKAVLADALDVPLHCGTSLRRVGSARPALLALGGQLSEDEDGRHLFVTLGCPDDMPRSCRIAVSVLDRGRRAGHRLFDMLPGGERRQLAVPLDGRLRWRARCRAKLDVVVITAARDAAGHPVATRRAYHAQVLEGRPDCRQR